MSLLAIGAAGALGAAMPWRRRIWEWMQSLPERLGESRLPIQVGGIAAASIMALSLSYVVLGGHVGTSGGGSASVPPAAPSAPTVYTITPDTNSVIIVGSVFGGQGSDVHDSTQVQVFRVANDMSGAAMLSASSGAQVRDTLTSNDSLKADTTYKARIRYKGRPDQSNAWSAWSAPDTFANQVAIFAMNYDGSADSTAGWSTFRTDVEVTQTRQTGVGPGGENAYRQVFNVVSPPNGDFYMGWRSNPVISGAPFAYGDTVYFSWAFRFNTGHNSSYYEQGTSNNGGIGRTKVLILNDGGGSARTLVELWDNESPQQWLIIIDDLYYDAYIPFDTGWNYVQIAKKYSSSLNAADGWFKMWIDNSVVGSPDVNATGLVLNASGTPGDVQFTGYANNAAYTDGVITWDQFGFQITDAFRAGWAP